MVARQVKLGRRGVLYSKWKRVRADAHCAGKMIASIYLDEHLSRDCFSYFEERTQAIDGRGQHW